MRIKDVIIGSLGTLALVGIVLLVREITKTAGRNSPIKVVGGSLKLKAEGKWKAQPSCPGAACVVVSNDKVDTTQIAIDDGTQILSYDSLSSWVVTINLASTNGSSADSNFGLKINPSDGAGACIPDHNLCKATNSSFVASATLPTDSQSLLIGDAFDHPRKRFRYRNPNCCNGSGADFRETVKQITLSYVKNGTVFTPPAITCANDGECHFYIGKE